MDGGLFIPNYGDRMAGQVGASDVTGRWDRWSARKLAKWAMRTLFGNPWTNTRNRYLLETYGALLLYAHLVKLLNTLVHRAMFLP